MNVKEFKKKVKNKFPDKNIIFANTEVQNLAILKEENSIFKFWNNRHSEAVYGQMNDGSPFRAEGLEV